MDKTDKEEKWADCCKDNNFFKHHHHNHNHGGNAIYGLGVVGALLYFLQGVTTVGAFMVGVGKAIFWPAILMFKLLTYLKM